MAGRQVAELQEGPMEPGRHRFALRERELASDIYFGRAWVGSGAAMRVLTCGWCI